MSIESFIEFLYLLTGLAVPLFYVPQILSLRDDKTRIASFSLKKARWQFVLRIPALLFAIFVVKSNFMIIVLIMDLLGRGGEILMAMYSLGNQIMFDALEHEEEFDEAEMMPISHWDVEESMSTRAAELYDLNTATNRR